MPAVLDKSHGWFRRWFRKVWKVRGGGLYALGFAVTFIIFEVQSFADDVMGIGSLFNGQAIEFIVQVIVDSFVNTWLALLWPLYVVRFAPPWGAIGLGVVFFVFATHIKGPLERWMFADMPLDENSEEEKKES